MAKTAEEQAEERGGIIAFRASTELLERVDSVAADEGISRSDVARRAVIRDLSARREPVHG
jgi:metal-responsive CopG/Arc/MetJ family transcriptional regulator